MRNWVLLSVLALSACTRQPTPQEAYDAAWTALREGRLQPAQDLVDQAIQTSEQFNPDLTLLRCEILLARWQGAEALQILERASGFADPRLRLRWLALRAEAFSKTERQAEALELIDAIEQEAGDQPLDAVFRARLTKGAILGDMGRFEEAESVVRGVAGEAEAADDSFNQTAALVNLSFVKVRRERYDESLEFSQAALAIAERIHAYRLAALASNNLGIAYTVLGDLTLAKQFTEKAVSLFRTSGDTRNLSDALGELGNVYLRLGDPARASEHYEEAVAIASDIDVAGEAGRWSGQLASAMIDRKEWDAAERWNRRALDFLANLNRPLSRRFLKLNEAAIARGKGRKGEALKLYRSVIEEAGSNAYLAWNGHVRLASFLAEEGRYDEADAEYRSGLEVVEQVRSSLLADDFRMRYHDLKMNFFRDYVDLLVMRGEEERALQVAEYSRVRVLAENLGIQAGSIGDVRTSAFQQYAARTGDVLLSYWLAPKRSFVWVVTARGIRMAELPGAAEIDNLVRIYRKAVEQDLRDPAATGMPQGEALSAALLDPVRGEMEGAARITVVPDGSLHALNLESLPVGETGRYWIEETEMSVAPSLTVLADSAARRGAKPSLLLVGAPVSPAPEYPALPAAEAEIAAIRRTFGGREQTIHTGAEATRRAFLDAMPSHYSMIHFAAHAEANPQSPLESAVILSPEDGAYKLYARDIAGLELSANLVTISACRSAGAQSYGGEGLVGFAWAFLQAGAKSVIAGLWDVGDDSSAKLMAQLYDGLARGLRPAAALREAKLSLLRSDGSQRKPFYWAPYQIYLR